MEEKPKFKSIRKQLLGRTIWALTTLSFVLFIMILTSASVLTQNTLDITMKQLATNSAQSLASEFDSFYQSITEMTDNPAFETYDTNKIKLKEYLEGKTAQFWCFTSFADLDGYDYATGGNVRNEEFFLRASSGDKYISAPYLNESGSVVYVIAAPAYLNGQLIGVIYMTPDYDYLYSLAVATSVGETGHIYVIDHYDQVIFDSDIISAMSTGASKHGVKTESHLNFEKAAVATYTDAGFGNFFKDGTVWVGGYAPVPGSDGWVILTIAQSFEFLDQLYLVVIGSLFLSTCITIFFVLFLTKSITTFLTPINLCVQRITDLAQGDLSTPVPAINLRNEAGQLADSTRSIVHSLTTLIQDEQSVLEQLAAGNFSTSSKHPEVYIGDFAPLLISINHILDSMNDTMARINYASVQVTSGAQHMSDSSISLAEGASKQATSTEELSVVLDHISSQVSTSAERATHARELTQNTGREVQAGNNYMTQLLLAMDDISAASQKIEQIIKNIEDIAFQTNILALNAAVEAARAGSAGSGFAVVADEVRNLANRSADNAKETATLIHTTLKAVENGKDVAQQTAESLKEVVKGVEDAVEAIQDIAEATQQQSSEIEKITENMEEITGVIQNTSATSKEGADTSRQLSAQAESLRELMKKFTLRR